jgi:hypothetical protein
VREPPSETNTSPAPASSEQPDTVPVPGAPAGAAQGTPNETLRCPHCHNPIRLADGHADEVLCPGCGSSFRVRDEVRGPTGWRRRVALTANSLTPPANYCREVGLP